MIELFVEETYQRNTMSQKMTFLSFSQNFFLKIFWFFLQEGSTP